MTVNIFVEHFVVSDPQVLGVGGVVADEMVLEML